jgi:hypothetical protein
VTSAPTTPATSFRTSAGSSSGWVPWGVSVFVDDVVDEVILPEALPADGRFDLEGHDIIGVSAGQSDMSDSSYVWVPDLSAAALIETTTPETRKGWIATLEEIQHHDRVASIRSGGGRSGHRRAGRFSTGADRFRRIALLTSGTATAKVIIVRLAAEA